MKAYLRLMAGLCPDRELLASRCQLSELSCQLSPISYRAKLWLIPKTHYLLSKNQLSAISDQPSALDSLLPAKSWLIPKTHNLIAFLILVFVSCGAALAQEPVGHTAPAAKAESISGVVVSAETGEPLEGATVRIKNTNNTTITNEKGEFTLSTNNRAGEIEVSFLGYQSKVISFTNINQAMVISLEEDLGVLEEVTVNTGYQEIPKERATGSFVFLDSAILNRSVSTNILDRLDGVTSGLLTTPTLYDGNTITIRGRSTIFGNADALIVLDGFPYEGNIGMINPNDVETISILKDAAAASIWGTRSGNGVIVITTKSGRKNQKATIGLNSVVTVSGKPDLFYKPRLSSADFIEQERFLFGKGYYNSSLNTDYRPVSEVVEMLWKVREGKMDEVEANSKIDALKNQDIRNDMQNLMYRRKTVQQYQVNLSGGSNINKFYVSGGLDRILENLYSSKNSRISFDAKNTLYLFDNKFEFFSGLNYTNSEDQSPFPFSPYSPYDKLADEQGNPLAIVKDFKMGYVDTVGNGRLLDWHYRPMEELNADYIVALNQTRLNFSGTYHLFPTLSLSANYQFLKGHSVNEFIRDTDKYYTRNLINRYSYFSHGDVIRPIAVGAITENSGRIFNSEILRFQLKLRKNIGEHEVNGVLGYEGSDYQLNSTSQVLYGYNVTTLTNTNASIDPKTQYRHYYGGASSIPTAPSQSETVNIGQSFYGNVNYDYKKKYIFSASFRRDESNIFGVESNQRGVPLWSTGLSWNLHEEEFYKVDFLSYLKLRLTYGYNGNVDKTLSGLLTVRLRALNDLGNPFADIVNPPNPTLRWEKVKTWNAGVDFSLIRQVVSGSFDVYKKQGIDLIGNSPLPPQTGVTQFKGNNANTKTTGIDFIINSKNLDGGFKWETNLLVSYNKGIVTKYNATLANNLNIVPNNITNPLEGYPYHSVFSFPSAGLDGNGMPQGLINDEPSNDYSTILFSTDPEELIFHGSSMPQLSGGIRNTFSYKALQLSLNLNFKWLYYFRRSGLFNGNLGGFNVAEYENRWQNPGDEKNTRIPVSVYPSNAYSSTFFQYSADAVERGDHIRMQDIRISYHINQKSSMGGIRGIQVFGYANNLGVIWKKTRKDIDPDYQFSQFLPPSSISMGINLNF